MITENRREKDVSNNKMSKLFSFEIIGSVLATAFIMGMGYKALASDQVTANKRIEKIEAVQGQMQTTVSSIQTDTAVIRNDQEHMTKTLEKNSRSIEKVLELLMKHDSDRNAP